MPWYGWRAGAMPWYGWRAGRNPLGWLEGGRNARRRTDGYGAGEPSSPGDIHQMSAVIIDADVSACRRCSAGCLVPMSLPVDCSADCKVPTSAPAVPMSPTVD